MSVRCSSNMLESIDSPKCQSRLRLPDRRYWSNIPQTRPLIDPSLVAGSSCDTLATNAYQRRRVSTRAANLPNPSSACSVRNSSYIATPDDRAESCFLKCTLCGYRYDTVRAIPGNREKK